MILPVIGAFGVLSVNLAERRPVGKYALRNALLGTAAIFTNTLETVNGEDWGKYIWNNNINYIDNNDNSDFDIDESNDLHSSNNDKNYDYLSSHDI